MPLSFENKKELKFVITLSTGKFGSSNNNQITLEGYRASIYIDKAGGSQMGTLQAEIYGVDQSDMNSITLLQFKPDYTLDNNITIYAVDGSVETLVFYGNIVNAWGNYDRAPDVFLHIQAQTVYYDQLQASPPLSYKGAIDVATIMAQIANSLGLVFENNNVHVMLTDVYLPNTLVEQAKDLAKMAGCTLIIDDNVLAITPKNIPRNTPFIPEISPTSGLIGYPTFDGFGVNFQCLFNPSILFGGLINLVTEIQQAQGQWVVTSVALHLESEKPNGAWFAQVRGNISGLAITK